jgi:hypothetical protein
LVRETWAVFTELVGELAELVGGLAVEFGEAIVTGATKGLGVGGVVAAFAALGVVVFVATR